ncbi:MAG: hypothetical protein KGN74_00650, partial [Gemmatimonadota bacterium]|nr:hypothetical protein [Gemmatimonadota bacterium]
YVEMMTPGTTIAESFPYKLAIGDSTIACAGAAPVTAIGMDSASAIDVNCPLAISATANSWLTSRGDVNVKHHGTIQITGAGTWLYVEGSLNYKSDQSSQGLLTGGSIQVMGPGFYQDTVAGVAASYENFYSTGTTLLLENMPYGPQMNQTIQATSDSLQFWTLSLVNFQGGYTTSLAAPGATAYNVVNGLVVSSSGVSPHFLSIPAGVTLNAGSVVIGSTGHITVSGALNVAGGCSSSIGAFVTVNAGGSVTPASCYP